MTNLIGWTFFHAYTLYTSSYKQWLRIYICQNIYEAYTLRWETMYYFMDVTTKCNLSCCSTRRCGIGKGSLKREFLSINDGVCVCVPLATLLCKSCRRVCVCVCVLQATLLCESCRRVCLCPSSDFAVWVLYIGGCVSVSLFLWWPCCASLVGGCLSVSVSLWQLCCASLVGGCVSVLKNFKYVWCS